MQEHSNREYLAWQQWLDEEENLPSTSDHYLMRISQRIGQIFRKDPQKVTLEEQKITFQRVKPAKPLTRKEAAARAKEGWFSRLGMKDK